MSAQTQTRLHAAPGPIPYADDTEANRDFLAAPFARGPLSSAFTESVIAMLISDSSLPDHPVVCANAAFEALTGYAAAQVVGRNCRFLQGPATDRREVDRLAVAIARRERVTVDLLNHRADGAPFWNRLHIAPVMEPGGGSRFFTASLQDVTLERERHDQGAGRHLLSAEVDRARAELGDVARRLQLAQVADDFGSWSRDLASNRLAASGGCKALFGLHADAPFTHEEFVGRLHPDDRERVQAAAERTERDGSPFDIEYRILRGDGAVRWLSARGEMLRRRDGTPFSVNGFLTDVTARREAEEHGALAARELSHRIRNILSIVSAVVAQSLRGARSLDEAQESIAGRIAALAAAQDELVQAPCDGARIGQVADRVLRPFDPERLRIHRDGPEVTIGPDCARAVAMTLHELATNAVKYGALSCPGGKATLTWRRSDALAGVLDVEWRERDGPVVVPPSRSGFGSTLIGRVMAPFVAGPAEFAFEPEGLVFRAGLKASPEVQHVE